MRSFLNNLLSKNKMKGMTNQTVFIIYINSVVFMGQNVTGYMFLERNHKWSKIESRRLSLYDVGLEDLAISLVVLLQTLTSDFLEILQLVDHKFPMKC